MSIQTKIVDRGSSKQVDMPQHEAALLVQLVRLVTPDMITAAYAEDIHSMTNVEDVQTEMKALLDIQDLRRFLIQAL